MLAKLLPATLMLMKGPLPLKSIAAVTVSTVCLQAPSLASAKWADCTSPYNPKRSIISSYKVELKTNSDKVSVIRNTVVLQEKLPSGMSTESANVQIIAPARWFPAEVVIGPFDGHPVSRTSESGSFITNRSASWLKISRQDLSWDQGIDVLGTRSWYGLKGSCRIIPNPVKTLF